MKLCQQCQQVISIHILPSLSFFVAKLQSESGVNIDSIVNKKCKSNFEGVLKKFLQFSKQSVCLFTKFYAMSTSKAAIRRITELIQASTSVAIICQHWERRIINDWKMCCLCLVFLQKRQVTRLEMLRKTQMCLTAVERRQIVELLSWHFRFATSSMASSLWDLSTTCGRNEYFSGRTDEVYLLLISLLIYIN